HAVSLLSHPHKKQTGEACPTMVGGATGTAAIDGRRPQPRRGRAEARAARSVLQPLAGGVPSLDVGVQGCDQQGRCCSHGRVASPAPTWVGRGTASTTSVGAIGGASLVPTWVGRGAASTASVAAVGGASPAPAWAGRGAVNTADAATVSRGRAASLAPVWVDRGAAGDGLPASCSFFLQVNL
ncbi:unnamed protein product, partial [Urochloa humidicola]